MKASPLMKCIDSLQLCIFHVSFNFIMKPQPSLAKFMIVQLT